MGRRKHKPTDKTRSEVSALCTYGVSQDEIAKYIEVCPHTLREYYREELDTARTKAHAVVGKYLYQAASGAALANGASHSDCLRAAMFWAKTQMNWRETENLNHTSEDGSMSPVEIVIHRASDLT